MMARGPIPADILVCHTCDNVLCVNPAHLFLATNQENRTDCAIKERTRGPYGNTKLTADLVMQIHRNKSGLTDTEWGRKLNMHPTTIYNARIGKRWKHLPMPQ